MTTNHRPTLESKRGRSNEIKDTILHARSLPGQLSMKLRLDIVGTQLDSTLAKRAVEGIESDNKRLKNDNFQEISKETNVEKEYRSSDPDEKDAKSESSSEEEYSSDEESQDEEELLMKELAKVKQEKEEQRKKKEALVGNPLIAEDGSDKLQKKSWRSGTAFKQKPNLNADKKYTADTLSSSTHQNFLSKYIR